MATAVVAGTANRHLTHRGAFWHTAQPLRCHPALMLLLPTLISLATTAAGSPAELYAVVGPRHEHVTALIRHENASVLLHHKGFTVVEANGTLPRLPKPARTVALGREVEGMRYFVLNHRSPRRHAKNTTATALVSDAEWGSDIKARNEMLKIVFSHGPSVLYMANPADFPDVAASEDAEADNVFEGLTLPRHTHFLPLYSRGLSEAAHRSNSIIENRTAAGAPPGQVIRPDPTIERLVEEVSAEQLEQTVSHISQTWVTRQAATPGADDAAVYLREQFLAEDFDVELDHFDDRWGPNVIATKVSAQNPHTWVVVGAHYDSRGRDRSSLTEVAPGARQPHRPCRVILPYRRAVCLLPRCHRLLDRADRRDLRRQRRRLGHCHAAGAGTHHQGRGGHVRVLPQNSRLLRRGAGPVRLHRRRQCDEGRG
jgi:hypothetical protein